MQIIFLLYSRRWIWRGELNLLPNYLKYKEIDTVQLMSMLQSM